MSSEQGSQQGTPQGQQGAQSQQAQPTGGQQAQQRRRGASLDVLFPDEELLIDARPAWSAWAGVLILAGVILLGGLLSGDQAVMGVALIVALLLVGYVWYQRRRVRYLVTDRRVLVLTGITANKTNEAWLDDVNGMQTGASFIERLLGHGHITVSREILPRGSMLPLSMFVPGTAKGMTLGGINNYQQIAGIIRERQAEERGLA